MEDEITWAEIWIKHHVILLQGMAVIAGSIWLLVYTWKASGKEPKGMR